LIINETEAEQVRKIFAAFVRRGSLVATLEEIRRRGWKLKQWTTRKGKLHVGRPFDRAALVRLLSNVLYVGEVNHKGKVYAGEHEAIVNRTIWTKANDLLQSRARGPDGRKRNRHGAILQGLLQCGHCGSRMAPAYTTRASRRYRYYVCLKAQKQGAQVCPGQTIGAERIELAVVERVYELIANGDWPQRPQEFPENRAEWNGLSRNQQNCLMEQAVDHILYDHRQEHARIQLRQPGTGGAREDIPVRVGKQVWERQSPTPEKGQHQVNWRESPLPHVSRLIALATRLECLLQDGTVKDYADLARLGNVSRARITQIMNLRNLAPATANGCRRR
jgi:hypothetical protein